MGQTITIVTAVVGTLTAIALATISMFQVRETRRQVAVSQQQFRESIQARYDDMLPVVIPGEGFNGITPMYSYMNTEGHETTTSGYSDSIRLQNIGNGVAFNVSFTAFAILHPPSGEVKYTKGAIIHIPNPLPQDRVRLCTVSQKLPLFRIRQLFTTPQRKRPSR